MCSRVIWSQTQKSFFSTPRGIKKKKKQPIYMCRLFFFFRKGSAIITLSHTLLIKRNRIIRRCSDIERVRKKKIDKYNVKNATF